MTETALSGLTLESLFVELDPPPDDFSGVIIDALLQLGFNAADASGDPRTQWRVGTPLSNPVSEGRMRVEVLAPEVDRATPRDAWLWAHALAGSLPERSRVQPAFAGDVELPRADIADKESRVLESTDAEESTMSLESPDRRVLQTLLQTADDTSSLAGNQRGAIAALCRGLDPGTLAELVFYLSIDPQIRHLWTSADEAVSAPDRTPPRISEKFSSRLRSQLRRSARATAAVPGRATEAPTVDVQKHAALSRMAPFASEHANSGAEDSSPDTGPTDEHNTIDPDPEIVVRLNVTVTVETSEPSS